jgi:hypothetical protein
MWFLSMAVVVTGKRRRTARASAWRVSFVAVSCGVVVGRRFLSELER